MVAAERANCRASRCGDFVAGYAQRPEVYSRMGSPASIWRGGMSASDERARPALEIFGLSTDL